MRRTLIAIGCDAYDHSKPLGGAENDATRIYESLMGAETGDYDASSSMLILSPTVQELRDALSSALFDGETLDTLTIYFAGHGVVGAGSYYMAVRDTRTEALSVTALSLSDLLRMIAEAKPAQTYIVVDACEAGGLVVDLNSILKSELIGRAGTPGVSLLAMAAADESALETGGEGTGTNSLLDCITGKIFLGDNRPTLDLVEIGRAVSERVGNAGHQSPVVWGLNLVGAPSFCKNPHAGTGNAPMRSILAEWSDPASEAPLREFLPRLWESYVILPNRWDVRAFSDELALILCEFSSKPATLTIIVQRIADAFGARAAESADRFREIEIRAACAVAMLPYSSAIEVTKLQSEMCGSLALSVLDAIRDVEKSLEEDRFSLLNGGLSELYYLPLRLFRLLGWTGFAVHALQAKGMLSDLHRTTIQSLFRQLLDNYGLALVAMSDAQAPSLALAVSSGIDLGLIEETEELVGLTYASFVSIQGRPARVDIDPSMILTYLLARDAGRLDDQLEQVAQPTELGAVLLMSANLLGLEETIDLSLHQIDHVAINAFITDNYKQFGNEMIEAGGNATYLIGHDLWTIGDLLEKWPSVVRPATREIGLTAILASLLFPDRTPWFVFPPASRSDAGDSEPAASCV